MALEDYEDDALELQPVPDETRCPFCGEPPTDVSIAQHRLSNIGYLNDDQKLICENDHLWVCGVPIGTGGFDDLWCRSCGHERMLVHKILFDEEQVKVPGEEPVELEEDELLIRVKCPNPECYWAPVIKRTIHDDVVLIGYPEITGDFEGAIPQGYR